MLISHPDLTTSFALDSQLWVLGEQVNGLIARQGSLLDFPLVLTFSSVICPDLVVLFSLLSFDNLGRVNGHDNGLSDRSVVFVSQIFSLTRLVILTFLSEGVGLGRQDCFDSASFQFLVFSSPLVELAALCCQV